MSGAIGVQEFSFARATGSWPVLGHLLPIARNPRKFLKSLPPQGDLVEVRIGTVRGYIACHPSLVRHILLNDRDFDKGGPVIDRAQEFAGDGILTCPHSQHRRRRRFVQSAFDHRHLAQYAEVMTTCIAEVTGSWIDGQAISPKDEAFSITTRVASGTLFGTRADADDIARVDHAMQVVLADGYYIMLLPRVLKRLPTARIRRYARATGFLQTTVRDIVDQYYKGETTSTDLLTRILGATDEDNPLSADEAFNEILGLLAASVETTATAIAWSCLMMARHPDLHAELHAEAREVLGARPATLDDVPHLPVTNRFLTEILRMYPPAWISSRVVSRDTSIAGTILPAGSNVLYSPYLLHHRADLFPAPEHFSPDRWSDPTPGDRPRGSFLPFATGARQCLGNDFGFTEAVLAIASIAGRWRFDPIDAAVDLEPRTQISLTPPAVRLTVRQAA